MQREPRCEAYAGTRAESDPGKEIQSHHRLEPLEAGRSGSARAGLFRDRPQSEIDQRYHLRLDRRGLAVSGGGDGPVLTRYCRLVNEPPHDATNGL